MFKMINDLTKTGGRSAVVLQSVGANKQKVIQVLMKHTGISLNMAEKLVNKAPTTVVKGISTAKAEAIRNELERSGAKAVVRVLC